MLQYFISTTETVIVAAVLTGMLLGYTWKRYGTRGRKAVLIGALIGLLLAAVMAWMKNKTKLIDTGMWNIGIFSVTLLALLGFLVLDPIPALRKNRRLAAPIMAGILACALLFYALPDVLAYPYTIALSGFSVFSTSFIYRVIGEVLGLILVAVAGAAVYHVSASLSEGLVGTLLKLALAVNSVQQISKVLNLLRAKRIISGHLVFQIVKFTSNYSDLFIYLVLLLAFVAPVVLLIRSLHVNEPYENPAQLRKIRANWRSIRRWSTAVTVCFVLVVFTMTAVDAYANREIELSPTEECELIDDNLYIPFEQVSDGHLHRFAYTTENGVAVRFIIIKKPNSSSYGVGLDACEICGETGYYERNGQVVCNRCDVVMNINTIGFKGGCNPKVIEYSIADGYIIVPTSTLAEHESDFK